MSSSARHPRVVGSGRIAGMAQIQQAVPLVERQQALIEELRVRAPRLASGAVLARRLGVSVRTVERDVARLTAAGVPIAIAYGPRGGYGIDARASLPPVQLTPGEAAALIASMATVGPFSSATAQSALGKLLAALTGAGAHQDAERSVGQAGATSRLQEPG